MLRWSWIVVALYEAQLEVFNILYFWLTLRIPKAERMKLGATRMERANDDNSEWESKSESQRLRRRREKNAVAYFLSLHLMVLRSFSFVLRSSWGVSRFFSNSVFVCRHQHYQVQDGFYEWKREKVRSVCVKVRVVHTSCMRIAASLETRGESFSFAKSSCKKVFSCLSLTRKKRVNERVIAKMRVTPLKRLIFIESE